VSTALARGLTRRCPRCGSGGVFHRWLKMAPTCPTCGLEFEQEQGYWLGAVMLNTGITEGSFLGVFVGGMIVTWPDVPWVALLVVGVAMTVALPILLDPFTRTLWVALERSARRWSENDAPRYPTTIVRAPEGDA